MDGTSVVLTLKKDKRVTKIEGTRVVFSPHQCFSNSDEKSTAVIAALADYLETTPNLAVYGGGELLGRILELRPDLASHFVGFVSFENEVRLDNHASIPSVSTEEIERKALRVFLCDTLTVPRERARQRFTSHINFIEPTVLAEIAPDAIPASAWVPLPRNIYPIDLPQISIRPNLDLVLMDCPSRNLALLPNGLAYVNNALKKFDVNYQIVDLDIIAYHEFHIHRLFDCGGRVTLPSGRVLPEDPWQAEHYDVWSAGSETATNRSGNNEVLDFFRPIIDQAIAAVVAAKPKILGLSIQQCNEAVSREIVRGVKAHHPDIVILVGGFSCYNPDIGLRAFPECDYMCIGESDLTVGPLVEALARGERPANLPGILSRYDSPDYKYIPAPMVHDLDHLDFPKYEWADLSIYRNYNDYQLTPIIASRGCRWSRCTFCAERFYWRIRSPQNFVDELEWLVEQGCDLFMFNESDLNGMPERVLEICDEIIRRGLHKKVKLTGQLRIHKKSDRQFFEKLRAANFVALRFGVDAFSQNTLRLQKKGYTVEMISQNLKDCWEVGIYTEVNWVIGVPGETEEDVEEGIQLILANRQYIGRLSNINPLILVNGSVYWIDPESHNIVFKEPKEELYAKFPRALPADAWYSTTPYIDAQVRKERFERIVVALHDAGFPVGAWANRVIEDVKLARDPNRAAASKNIKAESSGETTTEVAAKGKERRVIAIESVEPSADGARAPAEPPLFGEAGKSPLSIRKLDSHSIVFHNGWYYGIPLVLGEVEISGTVDFSLPGVVRHATEQGLIDLIQEASHWANTRGQYDAQERQRAGDIYMRADSALGESELTPPPPKPEIIRIENHFVAVNRDALLMALSNGLNERSDNRSDDAIPEGRTPLTKLARWLPYAVRKEVRRLVHLQLFSDPPNVQTVLNSSDSRLLGRLMRGAFSAWIKEPLKRMIRPTISMKAASKQVVSLDGETYEVISAITKDALPELMTTIGSFNVVKYDGRFYALPHGLPIDWEGGDVGSLPGVYIGKNMQEVIRHIEEKTPSLVSPSSSSSSGAALRAKGAADVVTSTPMLLGSLEEYNIVSYEGWIYGIPQSLGPVELTDTDVMSIPGVIRDVSRDVVENEILDQARIRASAPA